MVQYYALSIQYEIGNNKIQVVGNNAWSLMDQKKNFHHYQPVLAQSWLGPRINAVNTKVSPYYLHVSSETKINYTTLHFPNLSNQMFSIAGHVPLVALD